MRFPNWRVFLLALALAIAYDVMGAEARDVVKIGGICDRTGESRIIGVEYCPAVNDYIALVNSKGGVLGHKLDYMDLAVSEEARFASRRSTAPTWSTARSTARSG